MGWTPDCLELMDTSLTKNLIQDIFHHQIHTSTSTLFLNDLIPNRIIKAENELVCTLVSLQFNKQTKHNTKY